MITEGLQTKQIFLDPNLLQVENQNKTEDPRIMSLFLFLAMQIYPWVL